MSYLGAKAAVLPRGWSIVRLGSVAGMIVPMRDKPPDFKGTIPWIRIEDFDGKYIQRSKSGQCVDDQIVRTMNLKIYPAGTVLCSCSCSMGATAIVLRPLVSNQTFIGIVPGPKLLSEFLYYALQAYSPTLQSIATGAIQQYLSKQDFKSLRVPVPPTHEQRAIADFLDRESKRLDDLIVMQTRLDELLIENRKAVVASAVCHGIGPPRNLRASGIEWLGEIPTDWKVTPVKRLFRLIVDPAPDDHGMELLSLYTDIGVRPRKDLEARGNKASTTDGYFRVRTGDFVFNKLLAWMGAIGLSEYDGVTSPRLRHLASNRPDG